MRKAKSGRKSVPGGRSREPGAQGGGADGRRARPAACPSCGKPVQDGWKACPACGAPIDPGAVRNA